MSKIVAISFFLTLASGLVLDAETVASSVSKFMEMDF